MFKIATKSLLSLLFLACFGQVQAQIQVYDTVTGAQMVANLVGTGITYSNPVLNCHDSARGAYKVISSNLGIGDGILLTSGKAKTNTFGAFPIAGADGPQNTYFAATSNNTPGDPELTALAGVPTFDACILEFDFVPDGDSLLFDYVFGSEEYDSYSCTGFNDVFAFFLSGPGIVGSQNVALVPGTTIPVSINSTTNPLITQPGSLGPCQAMGPGSPFSQYYNDNSNGQSITYYGLTTVLTARAAVIPCTTYHIKLAIADGSDGTLDSGVFLEANSFRSTNVKLSLKSSLGGSYGYLVEGCTTADVTVKRSTPFPIPQVVKLAYAGSAIRNVDYNAVPDSVIIPANDTVASFTFSVIQDNLNEGTEYILLKIINYCTGITVDSVSFPVFDYLPYTTLTPDTSVCQGAEVPLRIDGDTAFTWLWSANPSGQILNNTKNLAYAYPETTTTYHLSAEYKGCRVDTTDITVTVEPTPIVDIYPNDTSFCQDAPYLIHVNVGPDNFNNYNYAWAPNTHLSDPFVREPYFNLTPTGTYTYILAVQTPLGCIGRDTVSITTWPAVTLTDVTADFIAKYGDIVQLNAGGGDMYVWTPDKMLDFPNTSDPKVTAIDSATFQVIAQNIYGCSDTDYVKMGIDYTMVEYIPSAFSPNGDGKNDKFGVKHMKFQRLIEFRVFNRWGNEIFSTTDPRIEWDGTYKGVPQEIGTYNYLIRVTIPNGHQRAYQGDVTIIR
jgi:gliding motility-associated-like protein